MKKTIVTIMMALMLILTACGGSQSASVAEQPAENEAVVVEQETAVTEEPAATDQMAVVIEAVTPSSGLNTDYENAVSVEMQLVLGILKLADTDQAITAEQANVLLPLWTEYQTTVQGVMPTRGEPGQGDAESGQGMPQPRQEASGTPMPEMGTPQAMPTVDPTVQTQLDDLMAQIESAMTAEQMSAIVDMKITTETAMTIMQEQMAALGGLQGGGNDGQQPPQGDQGQMPQGTPPADGGQMGSGQGGPQDGGPGMGAGMDMNSDFISPQWVNMVIRALEKIAGIETTDTSGITNPGQNQGNEPEQNQSASVITRGLYTLSGGEETKSGENLVATETDQSAVLVTDGGKLNITNSTLASSGNSSSTDNSSFYGLNAVVLAEASAEINLTDSTITSSGSGANGAFATGEGAVVNLTNVKIDAAGEGAHGVMATLGGVMTLSDVDINTAGGASSAIATDRGSGKITVTGGVVNTSGPNSPGIYSTGVINVNGGEFTASGAEAAVIEGANSINLIDSNLLSTYEGKWGVLIYQSMSGDAEGAEGVFTMEGGSLAYTSTTGPLFYVTNSTGIITLTGVEITAGSGVLLNASAGNWGNTGLNGGAVIFTANAQTLSGDINADNISSVNLTMQNGSSLTGAINAENTAQAVNLTLDKSSTWNVTGDSYLTCLTDIGGISGTSIVNIVGNGFTVYYDASACPDLDGNTYELAGGGYLKPVN